MAFQPTANTAILSANASGATISVTTAGGSGFLITNTDSANTVLINVGGTAALPAVNVTTTVAISNVVANANANTVLATFSSTQGSAPYAANSYIAFTGFDPADYNSVFQVVDCTVDNVTVTSSVANAVVIYGSATQTINNATDVVPVSPRQQLVIGASPVTNAPGNITIGGITTAGTATVYVTPGL